MHKTRKSFAKRFKVTGSGKVLRRTSGKRHLLRKLSNKQKRSHKKDKLASKSLSREMRQAAPGKF